MVATQSTLSEGALSPAKWQAPARAPSSLASDDAPPLLLPGTHFTVALTGLLLGSAGLTWVAPELARGEVLSPRVLAVVHLFTLGWITTSILGALCQFLPVAVGVPIRSERAAYATLAMHAIGLTLFAGGVLAGTPHLVHLGATLLGLGLATFATNLGLTLLRATTRDLTFWALALADLFLVATLSLGVVLALNLHTGAFLGAARFTVLAVHIHVALAGWVLMVMVGVAHRLLPMFLLSHGASERPAQISVAMLGIGAALLLAPLGEVGRTIGGACIAIGAGAFLVQAAAFHRHRKRRAVDPGMKLALAGVVGLGAATLVAPFALGHGFAAPRLLAGYLLLAILGAVSTFIAGHYYKIVPFLVWYHRFGPLVGQGPVPKVADLYSSRAANATLALATLGTTTMLLGIALASEAVVRAGALSFGAAAVVETVQMAIVARRRPA